MVWSWPVDVNYHEVDEGPWGSGVRCSVESLGLRAAFLLGSC